MVLVPFVLIVIGLALVAGLVLWVYQSIAWFWSSGDTLYERRLAAWFPNVWAARQEERRRMRERERMRAF